MKDFQLSPEARALLTRERDAHAAALLTKVQEIRQLSPVEYLRRGVHIQGCHSLELAGRLAKSGWSSLQWDESKGAWRVYSASYSYETHVPDADVHLMFGVVVVEPDRGG